MGECINDGFGLHVWYGYGYWPTREPVNQSEDVVKSIGYRHGNNVCMADVFGSSVETVDLRGSGVVSIDSACDFMSVWAFSDFCFKPFSFLPF